MHCKNCGHEIEENDKFCSSCGYSAVENKEKRSFNEETKTIENKNFKNIRIKVLRVSAYIFGVYGFLMIIGNWINSSGPHNSVNGTHILRMFIGIVLMILARLVVIKTKDKQDEKKDYSRNSYETKNANDVEKIKDKKWRRKILLFSVIAIVIIAIGSGILSQNFARFTFKELPEEIACSSAEQKFLGNWVGQDEEGNIGYIRFGNDTKFEMTYPKKNRSMSGKYLIEDSNTINFYPTKVDGEIVVERIEIKDKFYFEDDNTFALSHNDSSAVFKRDENDSLNSNENAKINKIISKEEAIQILMNAKCVEDMTVNRPSEEEITIENINNEEYYRIPLTFTYSFTDETGSIRTRTTSEGTYYVNTQTRDLYIDKGNGLEYLYTHEYEVFDLGNESLNSKGNELIDSDGNIFNYLGLTKEDILDLFGTNYESVYSHIGEIWEYYDSQISFWIRNNKVIRIECLSGNVNGVQIGMKFSEIKSILGEPTTEGFDGIIQEWDICYQIDDVLLTFYSDAEDGVSKKVLIEKQDN
ncbi:zinc ribbon domain-containing protein [Anaeromicrobium sediminis]|uniref:zinc ribbon domain-containing protein n=1 Tax=Anaeromicrobium sediminis TaxID=1478221 RepID=UPI0015958877|nr:zinc ribbon domain-containing protein [Anaeromicrobium sediminis]